MYQEQRDRTSGEVIAILRVEDSAVIPLDPGNRDYAAYLAWRNTGSRPPGGRPQSPIEKRGKRWFGR
jgi:hypothetical protein